jgi:uncharacterized protein YukE
MADDVKVKFSGDFTDVPKGAQAAVNNAGSAMSSWFKDFGTSISASIVGSLALASIFGKFKDNISNALQYFRELDLTIRKVGGSGAEFQKLAGVGKQIGVSMEGVGRSVNFLNKYLGQAAGGSRSHQKSLIDLGFTMDEVTNGSITAIEIISRLGDEYDRTGNDTTVAAKAMEFFGRSGAMLIPIIKLGREELKDMTKDMKVYSEETIRAASETQKNVEKMERSWGKLGKSMVEGYANYFSKVTGASAAQAGFEQAKEGGGTVEQQAKSAAALTSTLTEGNLTAMKAALKFARDSANDEWFKGEDYTLWEKIGDELQKKVEDMSKIEPKKPAVEEQSDTGAAALTASSIQSIGGGDIASVLAGTSPMDITAENTTQANIYLRTLVENKAVETTDGTAAH